MVFLIKNYSIFFKIILVLIIFVTLTGFAIFQTHSANLHIEEPLEKQESLESETYQEPIESIIISDMVSETTPESVPESIQIDFDKDILFIGNSLTVGMMQTTNSNNTFLCKTGISLDGLKENIYEEIKEKEFKVAIIGMGTNELGFYTKEQFKNSYNELILHIKTVNPNAKIICMSVPPVTKWKSDSNSNFTNKNAKTYNGYIEEICKENNLIYLDNTEFFDEELKDDWSGDGIHFTGKIYQNWYEWIIENIKKT